MEFLKAENLYKVYGRDDNQTTALDHVIPTIGKGDLTTTIGSSGSGRSTLLRAVTDVNVPTSGKIYLDGQDVHATSNEKLTIFRKRQVGPIYQFHNPIPTLSVVGNITLPILIDERKVNGEWLSNLLELLGLRERKTHLPNQLLGGQRQRVATERALMNVPAVMLTDELTGSLGNHNGQEIIKPLKEDNQKYEQVLLLITRDRSTALQADCIITITDRKVMQDERQVVR